MNPYIIVALLRNVPYSPLKLQSHLARYPYMLIDMMSRMHRLVFRQEEKRVPLPMLLCASSSAEVGSPLYQEIQGTKSCSCVMLYSQDAKARPPRKVVASPSPAVRAGQ